MRRDNIGANATILAQEPRGTQSQIHKRSSLKKRARKHFVVRERKAATTLGQTGSVPDRQTGVKNAGKPCIIQKTILRRACVDLSPNHRGGLLLNEM